MKRKLYTFLLFFIISKSWSQSFNDSLSNTSLDYFSLGLFFDQDLLVHPLGVDEDRNYTMGLGFHFGSSRLRDSWITAPIKWMSSKLFVNSLHQDLELIDRNPFTYSLIFANGSFTPDDLASSEILFSDRPYGSITYLQQNLSRVDISNFKLHNSSFIIGVLGSYISREVQTEIHSWYNEGDTKNPRRPRGWHHQISNSIEPTFLITRSTDYLITKNALKNQNFNKVMGEIKHGWKYSLGYYTGFQYGMGFRFGLLNPNNWIYDINPLSNSNKAVSGSTKRQVIKSNKPEFYLLGGFRPIFVLYNALLNGQFKRSVHTINFQDTKHFLLEWDIGVAGRIPLFSNSILDIKWKIFSGRTAEFMLAGISPRSHYWGGIDLSFSHFKIK